MTELSFVVPGAPQPKRRHQTSALKECLRCQRKTMRRQCQCGSYDLRFITNVESTPRDTVLFENLVGMCCRDAMKDRPQFDGAVGMRMIFWFPIPKTRAKKLKAGDPHCQRPDADNCCKSVLDGVNGVAWADDCIVYSIQVEKRWAEQGSSEVYIWQT